MCGASREDGFVISTEAMLFVVVLVLGLLAGWVKLRDQSLSELKDTMAAVDTYILGAGELWNTGGTRWIEAGMVIDPGPGAPVSEEWDDGMGGTFPAVAAEPFAVEGNTVVYRSKDGFLTYGADPAPSTTASGAAEGTPTY